MRGRQTLRRQRAAVSPCARAVLLLCLPTESHGAYVGPGALLASSWRPAAVVASLAAEQSLLPLDPAAASPFEAKLKRFAPASELPDLRAKVARLEVQLSSALEDEDFVSAVMLRDDLAELRTKDPGVLAAELRKEMEERVRQENYSDAARARDQLMVLRRFQPQYQLAGLWKGNYPNHGEALVRLRYEGETLVAVKVTGDAHVPAGEVTFRVDLAAPFLEGTPMDAGGDDAIGVRVEVVSLSSDGQSRQREVERYAGEGRIAARGFQHAHFVPGQLFLMESDVIGFLWAPLGTFVVFSRVDEKNLDDTGESEGGRAAAA